MLGDLPLRLRSLNCASKGYDCAGCHPRLPKLAPTGHKTIMGHDIKIDPAIERWAHLRENTHLYFGWNKRTTTRTLVWMGIVPVALTYLAYKTQQKWDFAASQTYEDMTKANAKQ